MATNNKSAFFRKVGIATVKAPETKEEIDTFVKELRHLKTGLKMVQVFDKQNISHTVFDGRSLVSWCLTFFKLANRADAINICKALMSKRFADNSAARYRFPEDEFDVYLKNLPEEQFKFVSSLMIGPLGVKMSFGNEFDVNAPIKPLVGSRLIGWLMKRFHDITSRNEAARFLNLLTRKGLLSDPEGLGLAYHVVTEATADVGGNIPLEICSTCKQFTALLSFQAKVTLSCGHTFHRSCLAELSNYEMGRCSECDADISAIKTKSELDLLLPFITKMLSSPDFPFIAKIDQFVRKFNASYIQKDERLGAEARLDKALQELTVFINELNELILSDLRVLTQQQHGREKSLLTLKKHILPQIFASLFPLYVKNAVKDEKLTKHVAELREKGLTQEMLGIPKKFRLDKPRAIAPITLPMPMSTAPTGLVRSSSSSALTLLQKSPPPSPQPSESKAEAFAAATSEPPAESYKPYQSAIEEFERLDDYNDIYDKLNCLVLTRHFIVDNVMSFWQAKKKFNAEDLIMASDELVLLMVFIIVYTPNLHLFAELNLLDDFIDEFSLNAEPGFCLTILQTALQYLHDTEPTSLLTPAETKPTL